MREPQRLQTNLRIINIIQRLAYHDGDVGAVSDLADWCLRQWLALYQDQPHQVAVLTGKWTNQLCLLLFKIPQPEIHDPFRWHPRRLGLSITRSPRSLQ